jgi:histidinol-phosphate aminotransferase
MLKPTTQIAEYILNKPKGYVDKTNSINENNIKLKRFDMGENRSALTILKEHLTVELFDEISSYPEPTYSSLTKKICEKYEIKKEQLTLGTGANEIIERINRVFLADDRECIVFEPGFYRIKDSALRCTKKVISIQLSKNENFQIGEKEISKLKESKDNSIIWICTPNNPVGTITSIKKIEKIAKENPHKIMCVDEAYGDYLIDWDEKYSAVKLTKKYENIIVIKTFSKLLGLAGLTTGYAISNKNLIAPLNNICLEFPITNVSEKISGIVLDKWDRFKAMAEIISKKRKTFEKKLAQIKSIEYIPSKTSIILLKHETKNIYKELLKKEIVTANMDTCDGIKGEGWVRVTIQNNQEDNENLIKVLENIN